LAWFRRVRPARRDEDAFVADVFAHWEGLFRYARRLTGSEQEAEDLVQEALTKGLRAFGRLREDTNHRAWIFTILRNTFLSRIRKQGRETLLEDTEAIVDPTAGPERQGHLLGEQGWRHGFEDEVLEALAELPEAQRTAVVLCDIEGLTYGEIAEVLDCPIGTVRSRIHHARRRLRETLNRYAIDRGYTHAEHTG